MAGHVAKGGDHSVAHGSDWRDYAEDATGLGGAEWRTARDLIVRPGAVLDAYVTGGPTGAGRYAQPTRFYLALCGVLMFYLFLAGGNQKLLADVPQGYLAGLARWAGKTPAEFAASVNDWLSLITVPLLSLFYTLAIAPLIKLWGGYRGRVAVRATLAMLCASTVPLLVLGPLPYLDPYRALMSIAVYVALIAAFVRMGKGVWWHRPAGAAGKSVLVLLAMTVAGSVGLFALPALAAVCVRVAG
jgi:hypothetical protein